MTKIINTSLISYCLTFLILVGLTAALPGRKPFACDPTRSATKTLRFCRKDLGPADRARDVIGRLTLPEKVRLLVNKAAAVPRLGMASYEWWSEALHGVANNVGYGTQFGGEYPSATSFPQVISTAATFNASLWEIIGNAVSDEARAMYNGGRAGLTFWSPNVNIFRDPRWGRGQETPGEDPLVAGTYAAAYVRGLQGNDGGGRLKVAACCKHYTAYDLDSWAGVDRFHFNAKVNEQDLKDTFDIPFRSCVKEGKVASVMCSYNQVNGIPSCSDPRHLRRTLRSAWHLNGYIVSDCDSVDVLYKSQHYTKTPEEAAAAAIKAGLDLDCGAFLALHTENAVKRGLLNESDINGALENTLTVQMRLGMFDGSPSAQPYGELGPKDMCSPTHQDLALEAARQSIVLLKNDGPLLPLDPQRLNVVAVVGPNSNATTTMIGNYAGIPCQYTSPLQGIGKYTTTIHELGCASMRCPNSNLFGGAISAAGQADATVLVMGLDQSIEAESKDRDGLMLPGCQQELISKVASGSKGPTILVLMSGGPIDVSFAQNDDQIGAIIWAGYPGQAGGAAIADVLFGAHNPGGKLPMTWYPQEYLNNLPMTRMDMRPDPARNYPGRTYRFYRGKVLYPFGHGLSYTTFLHAISHAPKRFTIPVQGRHHHIRPNTTGLLVRVSHAKCKGLKLRVHVDVSNVGPTDGSHTLLVYSSSPAWTGDWAPVRQLAAFEKVAVPAGGQQRVAVRVHACKHLSVVDQAGVRRIPIGEHVIRIGEDGPTHGVSVEAQSVGLNELNFLRKRGLL